MLAVGDAWKGERVRAILREIAGAIVTPDTLARGHAAGLDAPRHLIAHDSCSYFDALGDLVRTGPTLTNVNDIRAILIS